MKFCFLAHHTLGGSTKVALNIASEIAKRDHVVYVVFLRENRWTKIYQETKNLKFLFVESGAEGVIDESEELVLDWDDGRQAKLVRLVSWLIQERGIETLHYHYAIPFAKLCSMIKKNNSNKSFNVIGTLHGSDVSFYGKNSLYQAAYRGYLNEACVLTTVSHAHAKLSREVFGLRKALHVIPNFIVDSATQADENTRITIRRAHRVNFVHITNYRAIKNPFFIVKLTNHLSQTIPLVVHLIGRGRLLPRVIESFNISENLNVINHGFVSDPIKIIKAVDCMLISSYEESFSMAALESIYSGVPVLASKVGGLPELINEPILGQLYEPDNLNSAISQYHKLQSLFKNSDKSMLKQRMMQRAKDFEKDTMIEKYLTLYTQVSSTNC